MKNPAVSAVISLIGIIIIGSMMLFSNETPSTGVIALQWLLLAGCLIGLIGSLIQMGNRR